MMQLAKRRRNRRFPSNRLLILFGLIVILSFSWFYLTTYYIYFPYPGSQLPPSPYILARNAAAKKFDLLRHMDLESGNIELIIWLRTRPSTIRELIVNGMRPSTVFIRQSWTGYSNYEFPWVVEVRGHLEPRSNADQTWAPPEISVSADFGGGTKQFRAVRQPSYMLSKRYYLEFFGQYSNVWYLRDALPALRQYRSDAVADSPMKYAGFRYAVLETTLPIELRSDTKGVLLFPLPASDKFIIVNVF